MAGCYRNGSDAVFLVDAWNPTPGRTANKKDAIDASSFSILLFRINDFSANRISLQQIAPENFPVESFRVYLFEISRQTIQRKTSIGMIPGIFCMLGVRLQVSLEKEKNVHMLTYTEIRTWCWWESFSAFTNYQNSISGKDCHCNCTY